MSQTPEAPHELSRHKDLGDLQTLLLTACPPNKNGKASIPMLAKKLEISNAYAYKWIAHNRVPPGFVNKIVELSEGRVKVEDFHPYVFG